MSDWIESPRYSRFGFLPAVDNPKITYQCKMGNCGPEKACIFVSIDKDCRLYIQRKAISVNRFYEDLRNEVMAQRKRDPIAYYICLNADKQVPMANIFELIRIFKSLEIERISLVTAKQIKQIR
jgi:biopolymer transport protein ExbD